MINVLFYGTPDFSVPTLEKLIADPEINVTAVVTQPDRPAGRGGKLRPSPIKQVAFSHELKLLQPEKIMKSKAEFIEQLKTLGNCDIAVVIAFGQILPLDVLEYPKAGSVNIHASLLPRWRGAAPIQRAIMAGDGETGVALMKMERGLDTGAVYCDKHLPIQGTDTAGSLHDKLSVLGAELLIANIQQIVAGMTATPQPEEGVTYAEKISNEECLIDWNDSAEAIDLKVRGLSPFPGAFSFIENKRAKIYGGRVIKQQHAKEPGSIRNVDNRFLEVACGTGIYSIQDLQLAGKKRMEISEFLRGYDIPESTILGAEQ